MTFCKVDKQSAEEGLLYVTVAKITPDSDGDAPESLLELKKAAHDFAKSGNLSAVDHNHDLEDMPGCLIVENFVDEAAGSWKQVIDINGNGAMLQKARKGEITGVSLFGKGEVLEPFEKAEEKHFMDSFFKWFKKRSKDEPEMQKGFKENIATADWWRVSDAFTSAVRKVLEDETIIDKAAEIDRQVLDFSNYVKNTIADTNTNLKKGEKGMKKEELDKILSEKYGLKPVDQNEKPPAGTEEKAGDKNKDNPQPDTTTTAELAKALKRIDELTVAVDTLAKGRNTLGTSGDQEVTLETIAKCSDPVKQAQLYEMLKNKQ